MRKFSFRLDPLLRMRIREEETAARVVEETRRELSGCLERLQRAKRERLEYNERTCAESAEGVSGQVLLEKRAISEILKRTIDATERYSGVLQEQVAKELKTAIRNNSLTDGKISRLAEEYLRTGSPQGWRAAVTDAVMHTNTSGREVFLNKLSLDNPLMHMLNQMDGEY